MPKKKPEAPKPPRTPWTPIMNDPNNPPWAQGGGRMPINGSHGTYSSGGSTYRGSADFDYEPVSRGGKGKTPPPGFYLNSQGNPNFADPDNPPYVWDAAAGSWVR